MKGTKRGKVKRQQKLFDGLLARVVELKIVFLGLVSKSTETSLGLVSASDKGFSLVSWSSCQ